jgi:predicted amidohydrolase
MLDKLKLSILQMQSKKNHEENIKTVEKAASAAQHQDILILPEYSGLLNKSIKEAKQTITPKTQDPFILACKGIAKKNNIWIHIGSTPVKNKNRLLNHSALIDNKGKVRATYNKIHMFDIYPEGKKPILESNHYNSGKSGVLVKTPWGFWGMSVCYDLRFPYLHRKYAQNGATILFVPSSFTTIAGEAHWEVLLRARAIETGCWVIAAAQVGKHEDGRETYGHSLLVNPWGKVVADLGGKKVCQKNFEIDINEVQLAQQKISSFKKDQNFDLKIYN